MWEIRHILPDLDLANNSVTDVRVNVGEVAYLPCRFPQLSTLHHVSLGRGGRERARERGMKEVMNEQTGLMNAWIGEGWRDKREREEKT